MTMITIRYHGGARELRGQATESLSLTSASPHVRDVREALEARVPALVNVLARCRFARNGDFAELDDAVGEGDEIDVLPPVAGGSDEEAVPLVAIREATLSIDECHAAVSHPGAGAVVIFTGVVRDHANGVTVTKLEYEAHGPLAQKELRRVLVGISDEMPGVRLATTHRVGTLLVGELAIVIAVSAAHRAEAFAACRLAIDRLKETVPIWKKEWDENGSATWVNFGSG